MKILNIIKAGWAGLLSTTGGTLLFAMLVSVKGFPTGREIWLNLWPVITGSGMIASVAVLRSAYRKEPPPPGYWHLSIMDLVMVSVSFGVVLLLTGKLQNNADIIWNLIVAFVFAGVVAVGFLAASRRRLRSGRRVAYGFAFSVVLVGLLSAGGIAAIMTAFLIYERDIRRFIDAIERAGRDLRSDPWNLFGVAIASIILAGPAMYLCHLLSKSGERAPTPSLTDSCVVDAATANRNHEPVV